MNSTNNRRNHDFQILHFLVGSCHTADGAYALLCDLQEERKNALGLAEAAILRIKAKIIRADRKALAGDEAEKMEAEAEKLEIEAMRETGDNCLRAAQEELAFIRVCMAKLETHRKFKDMPLHEAHEAAQREEWKLELIDRAENHITATGFIPPDELKTMRMHPDFAEAILPVVNRLKTGEKKMLTDKVVVKLLNQGDGENGNKNS